MYKNKKKFEREMYVINIQTHEKRFQVFQKKKKKKT